MRLLLAAAFVLLAIPAMAAQLDVRVTNIRNGRGIIAVAVCDKPNFPTGVCPYRQTAQAAEGAVTVRFPDVPTGTWAVAAYHDEARVGRLEFSFLGIPKQGFGFSRDAKMHYGPPSFADAAFTLGDRPSAVTVPLHYPPP